MLLEDIIELGFVYVYVLLHQERITQTQNANSKYIKPELSSQNTVISYPRQLLKNLSFKSFLFSPLVYSLS
jgi:hypothetical protein